MRDSGRVMRTSLQQLLGKPSPRNLRRQTAAPPPYAATARQREGDDTTHQLLEMAKNHKIQLTELG